VVGDCDGFGLVVDWGVWWVVGSCSADMDGVRRSSPVMMSSPSIFFVFIVFPIFYWLDFVRYVTV